MAFDFVQIRVFFRRGSGMVLKPFEPLRRRLAEKASHPGAPSVTYVAFGDSVTQGVMQYQIHEYELLYHRICGRNLEQHFPGTVLNVINSGVSGDTALQSLERWERDVQRYRPDLLTIMFGHNDVHAGAEGLPAFIDAIDELIRRTKQGTEAEVVLITPCMMMKQDNERIAQAHREHIPQFVAIAEEQLLPLYVSALRKYAAERSIACLDAYGMWETMERQGIDIHTRLANGINHPDQLFHIELGNRLYHLLSGNTE